MRLLSHRGHHRHHIENTRAAFDAALNAGFAGLELDLRSLGDGTVVVFHDEDLWRLAAVLASPHATVEAMRRSSGNALSPTAMRLSARLVADLALPADLDAWDEAAQAMCDGEPLTVVAEAMCDAYGIDSSDPIVSWWMGRAGKRLA